MLPLVTVMIPTWGQERFIGKAIDSALAQTYPNIEILIADDASPDDTAEICAEYASDPRIRYVRRNQNLGRVANYRQTLADAAGEWVVNLDGDDFFIDPTFIARAMDIALSDDRLVMVMGKALIAWEYGTETYTINDAMPSKRIWYGNDFLMRYPPHSGELSPPHLATIYKRAAALKCSFYTADIISSDSDSIYRLMIGNWMGLVDSMAGCWLQHGKNASHTNPGTLSASDHMRAELIYQYAQASDTFSSADLAMFRRKLAMGNVVADIGLIRRTGQWYIVAPTIARALLRDPAGIAHLLCWIGYKVAIRVKRKIVAATLVLAGQFPLL